MKKQILALALAGAMALSVTPVNAADTIKVKQTQKAKDSIGITWGAVDNTASYKVFLADGDEFIRQYANTSRTELTFNDGFITAVERTPNLENGQIYVQAVKKDGSVSATGALSLNDLKFAPGTVEFTHTKLDAIRQSAYYSFAVSAFTDGIEIEVLNKSGRAVYKNTLKDINSGFNTTVNGTVTVGYEKIKSGKTIRMRAYNTTNGEKTYGAWSTKSFKYSGTLNKKSGKTLLKWKAVTGAKGYRVYEKSGKFVTATKKTRIRVKDGKHTYRIVPVFDKAK